MSIPKLVVLNDGLWASEALKLRMDKIAYSYWKQYNAGSHPVLIASQSLPSSKEEIHYYSVEGHKVQVIVTNTDGEESSSVYERDVETERRLRKVYWDKEVVAE